MKKKKIEEGDLLEIKFIAEIIVSLGKEFGGEIIVALGNEFDDGRLWTSIGWINTNSKDIKISQTGEKFSDFQDFNKRNPSLLESRKKENKIRNDPRHLAEYTSLHLEYCDLIESFIEKHANSSLEEANTEEKINKRIKMIEDIFSRYDGWTEEIYNEFAKTLRR